ncbi:hypothetical protein [Xanthomonas pisi]|uniref:hypothetical protein n=1 Tax=Xanthomonas pisi TaxID=56457 RepID=UPI0012EECB90|nr:hypothetical protein [Xanthomonas pisi]
MGAPIGGAGGALFVGIGELVGRGRDPVQGKIGRNDPNGSAADTIDMNSPNSNSGTGTIIDNTLPYIRPGSKVIVAGKVAFTAPKAGSLVLSDASTWFSQQIARLPEMIDTSLPVAAQFEQAYQLRQMLRASGANSLVDSTLRGEFLEEFVLASRENIRAEFSDKLSGDPLYRKMLAEVLTKVDDTIASEPSCFIAGTFVWTPIGRRPRFPPLRSVTQTSAEKLGDGRLFPWIVFEDGNAGRHDLPRRLAWARLTNVELSVPPFDIYPPPWNREEWGNRRYGLLRSNRRSPFRNCL